MHPYTQYPDCPGCQPGPPIYAGDHSNGPAYSTNESTYNSYRYRNKRKAAELALEQRASRASNRRACGVNFPGSSSESSLNTIEISCEPFGGRFIDVGGDGMAPDWTQAPWRVASPGSGCRDNLQIIVVKRVEELAGALSHFKDTMTDPIVSIDLEWRPDSKYTDNNVALIQLSSQTVCLLLRCYQWRHARGYLLMPIVLHQFFKDPSNFFVACAWDNGDERKMQSTFGLGRRDLFSNFYDVQEISFELGYPENSGLSSLSRYVLHEFVPKFRSMSRTNWERNRLSEEQVDYAASDAYITGQLFRTFRYWKISSESCLQCKTVMGRQVRSSLNLSIYVVLCDILRR
jgi:ribonuclease D